MKRILLIALILLLTSPVFAFTQDFQDSTEYTKYGTSCAWTQNLTGGNSFITSSSNFLVGQVNNSAPEQTNYAAFRALTQGFPYFYAYDSSLNQIADCSYGGNIYGPDSRIEMVVSDGTLYWYFNGVELPAHCPSTAISVNPSYVGFTGTQIDDFTYGSSVQRVVYGMPNQTEFIIKKDILNPSAAGVAFASNGTVVSSTYLTTTWSRSAVGSTGGLNDTLVLANIFSGTIYATKYTGSKNTSTEYWDIDTALIDSGAPYGSYETYLLNETGTHSNPINFIGMGASISFDKDTYSQQEIATITHTIADGGYWDTGTYSYKLAILNGNTWTFANNETIAAQSGTSTYTFTSSDTQGTYYAIIIATNLVTGEEVWLNYDWADVSAYVTFTGYVTDAETTLPISGANVSFSQSGITSNTITIADGNYTATGFLTGAALTINVTATGYSQYYVSLTPMAAKSIPLNITLNSTTPTYTGLGIGGIDRDGILSGTTITYGYGRPIPSATCYAKNTTFSELYNTTTNIAGWYLIDETTPAILTSGRLYDFWCEKIGYGNSPNYTVVAA